MAKALRCDNCKNFFEIKEWKYMVSNDIKRTNNIAFSQVDTSGQRLINNYDICPECVKKVFEALPGIMKKEGHDEN